MQCIKSLGSDTDSWQACSLVETCMQIQCYEKPCINHIQWEIVLYLTDLKFFQLACSIMLVMRHVKEISVNNFITSKYGIIDCNIEKIYGMLHLNL